MLDWKKHKLESRLLRRNINNLRYADDITFMATGEGAGYLQAYTA